MCLPIPVEMPCKCAESGGAIIGVNLVLLSPAWETDSSSVAPPEIQTQHQTSKNLSDCTMLEPKASRPARSSELMEAVLSIWLGRTQYISNAETLVSDM